MRHEYLLFAVSLCVLPAMAAESELPVVYNHVSATRTELDNLVNDHFGKLYRVIHFTDQGHSWVYPKGISGFGPNPPAYLENRCISGHVLVIYVISLDGRSRDAFAVKSTHPYLATLALRKVSEWRTQPGILDGKSVSSVAASNLKFDCPATGDGDEKRRAS